MPSRQTTPRQTNRSRLLLGVSAIAVGGAALLAYCFSPYAVATVGIDLRPPWVDEVSWHLSRIEWYVQDAGAEHIVRKHRDALIAMQADAAPGLIEVAANGRNRHARERAVLLLGAIGSDVRGLVSQAADNATGTQRLRLLYTQFVAFEDRDAFAAWLQVGVDPAVDALGDSFASAHILDLQAPGMPDIAVLADDGYAINPAFVTWWEEHADEVPFQSRAEAK